MTAKHPCQWTAAVLDQVAAQLDLEAAGGRLCVLDPFAGTGLRVAAHETFKRHVWWGVELEESFIGAEWVQHGNARHLPFGAAAFNAAATSFVFPNRMCDDFISTAKDLSRRYTYSHFARANRGDRTYRLHTDNAGKMTWGGRSTGGQWQALHTAVIAELIRVLTPQGLIIVEISNHLTTPRKGGPQIEIDAIGWVKAQMAAQGCDPVEDMMVPIRGMRHGTNAQARTPETCLTVWRAP